MHRGDGDGKAFCAGGDVKDFAEAGDRVGVVIKELTTYLHGAVSRLARTAKPVIMGINGIAAGGGMSFALSGDLVVAAESAKFTMAYSRIAASPDGSSSYFLPRLIGLRRALELHYTNRVLTAREALDWGLVNRVHPDAEFPGALAGLARELAAGPPWPSAAPSSSSTSPPRKVWRPRWSWRLRPLPPAAIPRISRRGEGLRRQAAGQLPGALTRDLGQLGGRRKRLSALPGAAAMDRAQGRAE